MTDDQVSILYDVLEEHLDHARHYPEEFNDSERVALKELWDMIVAEGKVRGIVA